MKLSRNYPPYPLLFGHLSQVVQKNYAQRLYPFFEGGGGGGGGRGVDVWQKKKALFFHKMRLKLKVSLTKNIVEF